MLVAYPIETVLLGALAIVVGGPIHPGAVIWGSLYGIGMAFGMWAFFAALGAGPISVVSPLAAVLNAGVPVAVGVALGHGDAPAAFPARLRGPMSTTGAAGSRGDDSAPRLRLSRTV